MKRFIALLVLVVVAACSPHRKYSDFDYSYARSGGLVPIYENLWIKGNAAHYSFEGQGKKIQKDFKLTPDELKRIEAALVQNNFRMIQEDYKKIYDRVATSVNVKKGPESGSKSDASLIRENDTARWNNVVDAFKNIIETRVSAASK